MPDMTVISKKTPKTRRPAEKKIYFIATSLKKQPILLGKSGKFTIGRTSKTSLRINEGTVSELHASIRWSKSSFRITDEHSTNGTFVNGKRIDGTASLKNGDRIKLGKFVLRFGIRTVREKKDAKPKPSRRMKRTVPAKRKTGKTAKRAIAAKPKTGSRAKRAGSIKRRK